MASNEKLNECTIYTESEENFLKAGIMTNKSEILHHIKDIVLKIKESSLKQPYHTTVYYKELYALIDRFIKKLNTTDIISNISDYWGYELDISNKGISLYLKKYYLALETENTWDYKTEILYLQEKTPLLTLEEFAGINNTTHNTAKQWLRRGKIPTARKIGGQWYILSLTEVNGKTAKKSNRYEISKLTNFPHQYELLNQAQIIEIDQRENDGNYDWTFKLSHFDEYGVLTNPLTRDEKEKLEIFLISSDDAEYYEWPEEGPLADIIRRDLSK